MKSNLTYLAAAAALALTTACGNSNNAVGENRPDAAAVNRAAQVTNSSDNKEPDASATRDAAGTSGQTAGQAMDRTDRVGEGASNASLTAKIQAKFMADDLVKARRIDVDSKDGVVTLSGSVMSKAESDKAEQLARQTDDVKRVVNNLKVEARH